MSQQEGAQPHAQLPVGDSNARRWVVVADGGSARVLRVARQGTALEIVRELASRDIHHKTHDIVTDGAGRSFESASATRHAIEPKHDPHEMAKEHFVREVAQVLNLENRAGNFDELVVVITRAQAKTLRDALEPATQKRVVGTQTKDLTKVPPHDIWERLIHDGLLPPRAHVPGA